MLAMPYPDSRAYSGIRDPTIEPGYCLCHYRSPGQPIDHYGTYRAFAAPLNAPAANLPALPALTDSRTTTAQRARAYLHTNCSNCHRPGGTGLGEMDLRDGTSLQDMGICNEPPGLGNLGISDARLLAPGQPAKSIIPVRMQALDFSRMPPLGSIIPDEQGIALINDWIASLTACR